MKVFELIESLQKLPPHLDVLIWDAGNRSGIAMVDDAFIHDEPYKCTRNCCIQLVR
jgi:hypothetical protein